MIDIYRTIGHRILIKRKEQKISQEYLAEIVGLHRNYIGLIERGQRRVTIENLYKIAKELNITLEEIFKGF